MADLNTHTPAEHSAHGDDSLSTTAVAHSEAAGAHDAHEKHPPEVPSGLDLVASLNGAKTKHTIQVGDQKASVSLADGIHLYQNMFFSLLIVAVVAIVLSRRLRTVSIRTPTRFQAAMEMVVEAFRDLVYGVLGETHGRRYLPYIGSLFLFIFLNNIMGIIPFMRSPSSMYQTTFALALVTFIYVQFTAISKNGPIRYIYHLMGEPKREDSIGMTAFMWVMAVVLLFPLHLLSEFIRPISLSLRLFGNILGEDILIGVFVAMGVSIVAAAGLHPPWPGVPLQLPFFFLALLTSTVQAIVFSLLSMIYILMALPHEDHGLEEHGEPAEQH